MLNKAIDMVDRAGGWMLWQVDNNNYLAGAVFGITLFTLPWLLGIIDIVVK